MTTKFPVVLTIFDFGSQSNFLVELIIVLAVICSSIYLHGCQSVIMRHKIGYFDLIWKLFAPQATTLCFVDHMVIYCAARASYCKWSQHPGFLRYSLLKVHLFITSIIACYDRRTRARSVAHLSIFLGPDVVTSLRNGRTLNRWYLVSWWKFVNTHLTD